MAATFNKSRRFMAMTVSSIKVTLGGIARENRCVNSLMLALAHAARCRSKSARLKSRDDLLRAAGSIYKNHRYSARLERFDRASADAAAQDGVTIPQPFDKSGVTVLLGATITRSASVFMTASIDTGLDEFHLPILDLEDEKLAAASKMGGNVDSIVRWCSNLHVRFSLADTDQSKHPTASPRADSEILDDFTEYLFQSEQPEVIRHLQTLPVAAKQIGSMGQPVWATWHISRDAGWWGTTEVQDFGGQRRSMPHRYCRASARTAPDRLLAKAVSREGTRNVLIGNFQFSLNIFVQRFYELHSANLVAGPHCKTLDVLYSRLWPRQCQKAGPCMGAFGTIGRGQHSLGPNQPFSLLYDPPPDSQVLARRHAVPEPDPQFASQRFVVHRGDCLGHRFVENRTDDPTVHNALKSLPVLCWPPFCRDYAITPEHILNAQSVRVVLPTNDAPVLRPCSETK
jgi:hypothetical protein